MIRREERRITSSYRREFSPEGSAKVSSAKKSLCQNLQYREQRRQIEHSHQVSPFIWDDWTYELNDSDEETVVATDRSRRSAAQKSDDETLEEKSPSCCSSSSKVSESSRRSASSGGRRIRRDTKNIAKRKPMVPTSDKQPDRWIVQESSRASSSLSCDCEESLPKARGVSARVLSDTISKTQKNSAKYPGRNIVYPQSVPIDGSPFAQYGIADDEMETGNKHTHNTLCHDQVYESAVNAKARVEATKAISKQRLKQLTAESRNRRPKSTMFDPRFDEKMNKNTRDWKSEYGTRYNKYSTSEYRHNLDHRPPY